MTVAQYYTKFGTMPGPGTRVKVVKQTSYKKIGVLYTHGTVVKNAYGAYGKIIVDLDGVSNSYSGNGHFYFKPYELELINEDEDKNVEEYTMPNVINYRNVARIRFVDDGANIYSYANFEPDLKAGDLCVVMSAHHGMGLAKVVEILEQNDIETPREVIAKVWTDQYDERVKVRKEVAELKAMMEDRAKQLQDIALYQMLAEKDSQMQDLLDRYQSLRKFM